MEQDRRNRTLIDLQGNIPTNFPEMAAQQRVAPTQTFDIGSSDDLMYLSPMSRISHTPQLLPSESNQPPPQAAPPEATQSQVMNVDTRVKLKARRSMPPPLAAPPEATPHPEIVVQPIDIQRILMDVEEVSTKRPSESREERIRKAAKGTKVITDLIDTMKTDI